MPRAIWSGSISFGLVNAPVRMYSAIDEQDLHFHLLHTKDDSRIGYEKVCKKEGKPVPEDEIVKAYEFGDGEYVYVTDEDFEAAEGGSFRTIDITGFVPYDEIDPIYFERTYYLGPAEGAEKVYVVLARAMEDSGLAAIATYVMRNKEQLGCLRVREGVITLAKMYFADEIRPSADVKPRARKVGKQELDMAAQLIDRFTGHFEPKQYEDTYRAALLDVIKRKRKGEEIHVAAVGPEQEEPADLLAALQASVEEHARRSRKDGKRGTRTRKSSKSGRGRRRSTAARR